MFNFPLFGLRYRYDIQPEGQQNVVQKIQESALFSFSFISLLIGSSIVCTLGLLIDSQPIVIGGMIISPLMWPLMKISFGVSFEKTSFIRDAIILLLVSVAIALASSVLLTALSPVKFINSEILARTTPTLFDLIVALVAGAIAPLAITQPKISESLAGVAIATSLMPPLCVAGIGLALMNMQTFTGGFLLFFANVIAIIFVASINFAFFTVKRDATLPHVHKRALTVIGITLCLTAIPLYMYLKSYTFKLVSYNKVNSVLAATLHSISLSIALQNVRTDIKADDRILVEAELLLPEDTNIEYDDKQDIVMALEKELQRPVDLNLKLQRTISVVTKDDKYLTDLQNTLKVRFLFELKKINTSLAVDSLEVIKDEKSPKVTINAVLRGDPSVAIAQRQQTELEETLSAHSGRPIKVNLEIIPRIRIRSNPEQEHDQMKKEFLQLISFLSDDIDITSVDVKTVTDQPDSPINLNVDLRVPPDFVMPDEFFLYIKSAMEQKFKKTFIIHITSIEKQSVQY